MNESEKSLISDLIIPSKELKMVSHKLLPRPFGVLDHEVLFQEMFMKCWELLTSKGFWVTTGKNHAINLIKHEKYERRHSPKLGKFDPNQSGYYDEGVEGLSVHDKLQDEED